MRKAGKALSFVLSPGQIAFPLLIENEKQRKGSGCMGIAPDIFLFLPNYKISLP